MTNDTIDEPDIDLDEPDIDLDDAPDVTLDPEPAADEPTDPIGDALARNLAQPLMQVLPADFPLPSLIRFVPDVRLKTALTDAATYALSLEVRGAEGLQVADAALATVRSSVKAVEAHFAEPVEIANKLHKSLTSTRADWVATGKTAVDAVSRRIYVEQQRLQALADEERRKAQAEADRIAREEIRKQAEAAAAAKAPAAVVENLQQQAKTAQAAPVATPAAIAPPKLANTTVTKKWTVTLAGTPRDAAIQQPAVEEMTPAQQAVFMDAIKAVAAGTLPLSAVTPNWRSLTARAKADESTFNMPGFEAYDAGGTRAKGSRK